MASRETTDPPWGSPKEDYNPLNTMMETSQGHKSDEEDFDSLGSSGGHDNDFMDLYGVTPPHNARAEKRSKQKLRSLRQKEDKIILAIDKASRQGGPALAFEHAAASGIIMDDVTIKIESIAESPTEPSMMNNSLYKRKNPKTFKHARSHERDYKAQSNMPVVGESATNTGVGSGGSGGGDNLLPVPAQSLKVDSPNRYYSLHSKQVVVSPGDTCPEGSVGSRRKHSLMPVECPRDRVEFYRTFSQLINMFDSARREKKETKASSASSSSSPSAYVRQLSSEVELWQNNFNDVLWLELRAYMSGRSMSEQDRFLSESQSQVESILHEVMNFKVRIEEGEGEGEGEGDVPSAALPGRRESHGAAAAAGEAEDNLLVEMGKDGTPEMIRLAPPPQPSAAAAARATTPTNPESLQRAVHEQKEALCQVTELLEELEHAEMLYPTTKALGKAHPLYASEQFQRRVRTLCLWRNVTLDLAHKLSLMAKMLNVERVEGLTWPWHDFNIDDHQHGIAPNDLSPSAQHDENMDEEGEGEEEECEQGSAGHSSNSAMGTGDSSTDSRAGAAEGPAAIGSKMVQFDGSNCHQQVGETSLSVAGSDASTPVKSPSHRGSLLFSRVSSSMSLEELNEHSPYLAFADRMLKKTGVRKMYERLTKMINHTLCRARQGIETPSKRPSYADVTGNKHKVQPHTPSSRSNSPKEQQPPTSLLPPQDLGLYSAVASDTPIGVEDFAEMRLPSYKPMYLFLARIPLNVVHECLRLRLEQKPETEPSLLSVRQLIRECKEVLQGSVKVKQYYLEMVTAVVSDASLIEKSEMDLESFEEDIKDMLEVYFNYLQTWMCGLQNLPEMSKRLKNALEEEWNFTKNVCPHVRGGEANASNRFCTMASSLLRSISDFLERMMDDCIDKLYDVTASIVEDDDNSDTDTTATGSELRQEIILACRNFKQTFHEVRERSAKALGFAKMLCKDLEIAADFNIMTTAKDLLEQLEGTGHVRVLAPHSAGYLMFVPSYISEDRRQILHLLNVTCGREETPPPGSPSADGYLLLVKCAGCTDMQRTCPLWKGPTLKVEPTAETTIALSHIEVECLLLVVIHSSQLSRQRKQFEQLIGHSVEMVNENTSCHQAIADSLAELKMAALDLREKVAYAISQVDEKLNVDAIPEMDEAEKFNLLKLYRETLHQCYNCGFEYHKEVVRLVSGDMRTKLWRNLIDFVKQWSKFVSEKCERGRGTRPRWAIQGLDFLIVACDPRVLVLLSDEEFQELKEMLYRVINHVIGEKATPGSPSTTFRVASPDVVHQRQHGLARIQSCPDTRRFAASRSARTSQSDPATPFFAPIGGTPGSFTEPVPIRKSTSVDGRRPPPEVEDDTVDIDTFHIDAKKAPDEQGGDIEEGGMFREAVCMAVRELEQRRTDELFSKNIIGRVINRRVDIDYHINIRRVNFKWQRGFKIGEGQFGKVYTAINIDNGEMMAMKAIRFQPNDHQTIKNIADEIKRFEGISHPSLVKYYGVEVHRDEMLIFMEYCSEGTIAEVSKLGLPEAMVRMYTGELLVAVNVLHDHSIVHRDITGANIFLTPSGLKLGDFGCSVQLKSHTTQPGEVKSIAGTTAYMAPEVITHNDKDGSGRAADIWSLGCVVIQMATGKRPWHELENNFMIMFKVGMGGLPTIPEHLSQEGKDFLSHCFETDPRTRWTASELQDHPFVKVYTEESAD